MIVDAKRLAGRILRGHGGHLRHCFIRGAEHRGTDAVLSGIGAGFGWVAPIGTKAPGDAGALVHDRIGS
jgi:hypothetical protein